MEECPKIIAGVQELYQQLLPTKVYYNWKTKSEVSEEKCRLCGDSLENVQHILSGCSALNLVPRGPFCHALELSIPVADQKDRGLWERDCSALAQTKYLQKT